MRKKHISLFMLILCVTLFASVPTGLTNVIVPVKILQSTLAELSYSGMVTYELTVGDNDSLVISLTIVPDASTPYAPACTVTKAVGDVGIFPMITGKNGKREIFFECQFKELPGGTDKYVAKVTINADQSFIEKEARRYVAGMSNSEKVDFLHGTGSYTTPDVATAAFGTIMGFHMADGPHALRNGDATQFPTSAASANAWDTALAFKIGKAIAEETQSRNFNVSLGPMLNIVRDPTGGRDFETYGEDPYLQGKLSSADARGIQSVNVISTPKHYVCNNRENQRNDYSSDIDDTTLRQIYAYPFEMTIREGAAWGIMTAYNKVNDVYNSENKVLLTTILKNEWGFRGIEMSDWGGTHSTVLAANAGHDIEMDAATYFGAPLLAAVTNGSVTQDVLDDKVLRVFRTKLWTKAVTSFPVYPNTVNNADHQNIAKLAARESLVLVKNDLVNGKPLLPLDTGRITTIAVVGYPDFFNVARLGINASESGTTFSVSLLQGIKNKVGKAKVLSAASGWAAADQVIVVVGQDGETEGNDRLTYELPLVKGTFDQNGLVKQVKEAGKNPIVVYTGGSASTRGAWYDSAAAILIAFYPGQDQGNAIADVLFGDYNPGGKITVSFPDKVADLPPFVFVNNTHIIYEKANEGRGYPCYLKNGKTPLIPFGYGLSYTTFTYGNLACPEAAYIGQKIKVSVTITNTGDLDGDEIPQLYIKQTDASAAAYRPLLQLRGFTRVTIPKGASRTVDFMLNEWDFSHWVTTNTTDHTGSWVVDPNSHYEISVGKYCTDPDMKKAEITLMPGS
jgi:beta-glucosidase